MWWTFYPQIQFKSMDADLHKVVFAESRGNPRGFWGQILGNPGNFVKLGKGLLSLA